MPRHTPAFQRACAFLDLALEEGPIAPSALKRAAKEIGINPALFGSAYKRLRLTPHGPDIVEQWWSRPKTRTRSPF